jgi:leucyl-tRNA synthetase
MMGHDTFTPMGFDAFGLPAENYAIKTGIHPDTSTRKNVETMITQLKRMGCMYDWEKMVNTSTPEYYRWTQWLFLQMFEHGLAYKKKGIVNWCPSCQTVLANEQVKEGKCDRCGTEVVQKPLEQWYWKILDYAERLLLGLKDLEWPEKTKLMQEHWIGKKSGINITYKVEGAKEEEIVCFTTRPDTNFGATFLVLAPEHPFVTKIREGALVPSEISHVKHVQWYWEQTMSKTELERQAEGRKKTGVFTGFHAINNLNGKKMPIWVSDFVLGGFGTGAVVGVPGHDKRDFEFAKEFKIPVIRVVKASDGDTSPIERIEQVQEEEGTMVNSEFLDNMDIHEATKKIMAHLEDKGFGKMVTTYRLRDWLVSRQRYWGAPIPIVYDPEGKPYPIPEKHLPWLLPTDVEFRPTGKSPLTYSKEFIERTEKIFGKGWRPEFDTMDTFVCSSFYELRYLMEGNPKAFVDRTLEKKWMPVSMYIGGPEHATMHLIYARFVMMALKDFGIVSHEEPFQRLVHQGLITNKGAKMSKSKGNVVSPDSFVSTHGSDVFRMYLMFMGPFSDGGDWNDTGIKGIDRFVQRVWNKVSELSAKGSKDDEAVLRALHKAIKRVTESVSGFRFNTAIAALMEFLNEAEGKALSNASAKAFTRLLAPLAPHLAEELWETLGGKGFVIDQPWPEYESKYLASDSMTIAVQVNGKLRATLSVPADMPEAEILAAAKADENVKRFLSGPLKKEIYIKGRLVSLVV